MPLRKAIVFASLSLLWSCKTSPHSDRNYDQFDPNTVYKLQLNPTPGSAYHYDITNESATEVEVNDKSTTKENKASFGMNFNISKDSSNGLLMGMTYDKIQINSKTGDTETTADASNANGSLNPVEKMLGLLKQATLVAHITTSGEVKNINGYQELGDKIIGAMDPNDVNGREVARAQWERQIGNNLVKNNMDQLFKVFPDSSVHLRDSWKTTSKQEGEIPFLVKNIFTLKAINSDIAVIAVESTITSDNTKTAVMGMTSVSADLKGTQEGEFEMETKTGMLINCKTKAKISGTLSVIGKEVPVSMKTSVDISGHRQ